MVFSRGGCLCLDACQGGKEKYAVCEPVRLLTCKASRGPTCHTATEGHCRSKSQVIQACTPDHLLYRILDRRDVFTSRLAIGLLWTGVQSPWTVVFSRVDRGGPYNLLKSNNIIISFTKCTVHHGPRVKKQRSTDLGTTVHSSPQANPGLRRKSWKDGKCPWVPGRAFSMPAG